MARIPFPLASVSTVLVAALGCSAAPSAPVLQAMNFHPITSGVTLHTIITSDTSRVPVLRITLENIGGTTVNVMTGIYASYPAANFTFQIALQDHRRFDLLCDLCGEVGVTSGRPLHYWVQLPAGARWNFDLPLRGFLYVDSGDRRLDSINANGATIVTTLQGVKPQEGVDVAHGETVWIGRASANVTLLAFTKRLGDHAKRFPGKVGKAGGPAGLDRAGHFVGLARSGQST
jgi:hypothetical protein